MNDIEQEVRDMLRTKVASAPVREEPPPTVLRGARLRRAANACAVGGVVAAAVVIGLLVFDRGEPKVVVPIESPSPTQSITSTDPFDGTIHGWRVAPVGTLDAEGLQRDLRAGLEQVAPGCEPQEADAAARTDLDFTVGHLPSGLILSHTPQVAKWICGDLGLSVMANYDFEDVERQGVAILRVDRYLMDKRIFGYGSGVPSDRVEPCTVRGFRAICIHPEDDETGRGTTTVFMIEDDTLDPFAVVTFVQADEIPYDEALRIAESIR